MNLEALTRDLLSYWFGRLNDDTPLDREAEPFATQYRRWYGKDSAVDAEIRSRFESALGAITTDGETWRRAAQQADEDPRKALAITILVDQLPRNMYRDTPQMYAYDALGVAHAYRTIIAGHEQRLSLVERMFAYVPLMHAEELTLQRLMEQRFEALAADASERSPHNRGFFEFARGYASRHREVVERFGRFPHRNAILGRQSTAEELAALESEDISF